ncbi:MAG: cobalamin biosynthesis protein CobW [Azospirillaceae bacterium]|nr:cobalamin biosynthesis protein CobW [Azospirillaceae bacterium]
MAVTLAKIPATVITGFLGAGKTTLIRHLIATAQGRRLALIINEFGDIGVDGEVLRGCGNPDCDDNDIIELANGCICCTVAEDFLPALTALIDRPDPPDHIVIETSGLALPKPLIAAFNWPAIRTRVTVDGVIAVVDGPAVLAGRFVTDFIAVAAQPPADATLGHDGPIEELFEEQLLCADLVLLNKCDRLDDAGVATVTADLRTRLRPGARVLNARHGAIDAAVLLGLSVAAEDDLAARPSHHDGQADHAHDEFESFHLTLGEFASPDSLVAVLGPVLRQHAVLRLKGFAAIRNRSMRLVVQAVGDRIDHYFDRAWRDDEDRATRLVVIGEAGLDRAAIAAPLGA